MRQGNTYSGAAAVTPSDTVDFARGACRAIYVGGAGNVAAVMIGGEVVTFVAPPVGTRLEIAAKRINATNTTATNLVALY
jgi:hypothetical protein